MSEVKDFRCPVCETVGQWENVDKFRLKPSGMALCQTCGVVQYPSKYQSEDEIKAYYRTNYRPAPQAGNLFTGERKLQYHTYFLNPLFEEWTNAGIKSPVIGEIGSAHGMFLNWIKKLFPDADVHGTELTESFKRVAFHEFGLKLKDDFDKSKKYDLITTYHVLEHQLDPDIRLKEYAACLKDSGVIYLSVPIWFREAGNVAMGGYDLEYYWAPDHINAWSEEHLEWIIARAGLEPIMKNNDIYGNTYILKKADVKTEMPKWDKQKYLDSVERLYKCWVALQENKTALAIEMWPNCPSAWVHHYELNRAAFHKDQASLMQFLKDAVAACPNSPEANIFAGDVMTRYDRFDEAYEFLSNGLKKKPNNPTVLLAIASCFRGKAAKELNPIKKEELYRKSINVLRFVMDTSTELLPQALSWAYHDMAQIPVPLDP